MMDMALAVGATSNGMTCESARRRQRDTRKGMARLAGVEAVRSSGSELSSGLDHGGHALARACGVEGEHKEE